MLMTEYDYLRASFVAFFFFLTLEFILGKNIYVI